MKKEITQILQGLHFTEYEAKAYLALLEKAPLSGYAVARLSGVPRAKIYEVLDGMVARGDVIASYSETVQYAPLPPRVLLQQRKKAAETAFQIAEQELEAYAASTLDRELIWDIAGREEIFERARDVIGRAQQRVMLHIWQEDASALREVLAAAAERGVEVFVIAYGEPDYPFARVYHHDLTEEFMQERGGRWLVLSSDQREIVAGIVSLKDACRAAWSSHPGLVAPITEQIKHDLYIMEMLAKHRDILEETFGPKLIRLREQFGPSTIIEQFSLALGAQEQPEKDIQEEVQQETR